MRRSRCSRTLIRLVDGRQLDVIADSRAGPDALLLAFGAPGGAVRWPAAIAAAERHELRYVTTARPGNGRSTRQPDRSVADFVGDLREVATRLGLRRIHAIGWSSGGPPILAAAALAPDLVASVAVIASRAPHREDGMDVRAEIGEARYRRAVAGPEYAAAVEASTRGMPRSTRGARRLMRMSTGPDRALAGGSTPSLLAALFREGLRADHLGLHDDMRSEVRDWGFRPEEIRVPVGVWHGVLDPLVSVDHGRWLASHIPAARAHLLAAEGHASIAVNHLDEIMDELVELGRQR